MQRLISFVVIAYNEEATILDCLSSVLRQIGLPESHEVIIVDDGSTDETSRLVQALADSDEHVRVVKQVNRGRGAARATGVREAKGDLLCMLDGDIVLPPDWLTRCLEEIEVCDAVGGTPVPDGDVAYIFNKFALEPRPVESSTTVTGSNGLYRRPMFDSLQFNPKLIEGEDTDFCLQMEMSGYRARRIPGLVVSHRENKSFLESMSWLWKYGQGATRNLRKSQKVRLPDVVFGVFGVAVCVSTISAVRRRSPTDLVVVPAGLVAVVAVVHVSQKFRFPKTTRGLLAYFGACCANSVLITAYLLGRTAGLVGRSAVD